MAQSITLERMTAGLTVRDVAARYRIGPDKVRGMIVRGELRSINTADHRCQRPRYVVTPEALAEWERQRQVGAPPPKSKRKRRAKGIDFFAD